MKLSKEAPKEMWDGGNFYHDPVGIRYKKYTKYQYTVYVTAYIEKILSSYQGSDFWNDPYKWFDVPADIDGRPCEGFWCHQDKPKTVLKSIEIPLDYSIERQEYVLVWGREHIVRYDLELDAYVFTEKMSEKMQTRK